jgi:hypothetical protein
MGGVLLFDSRMKGWGKPESHRTHDERCIYFLLLVMVSVMKKLYELLAADFSQ